MLYRHCNSFAFLFVITSLKKFVNCGGTRIASRSSYFNFSNENFSFPQSSGYFENVFRSRHPLKNRPNPKKCKSNKSKKNESKNKHSTPGGANRRRSRWPRRLRLRRPIRRIVESQVVDQAPVDRARAWCCVRVPWPRCGDLGCGAPSPRPPPRPSATSKRWGSSSSYIFPVPERLYLNTYFNHQVLYTHSSLLSEFVWLFWRYERRKNLTTTRDLYVPGVPKVIDVSVIFLLYFIAN